MLANQEITVKKPLKGVTEIVLNRPEKRNALNISLLQSICHAIKELEKDASQRILILRGEGPVFCSGLDLEEVSHTHKAEISAHHVAQTLNRIYSSPLITIASVHGAAVAGGAGLMSACDITIAGEDCRIGYPETRRGLVAALVMPLLVKQVGDRTARELLLVGELVEAKIAQEMKLVNYVVKTGSEREYALSVAEKILKGAPHATTYTKKLLNIGLKKSVEEEIRDALNHHVEIRNSTEAQEGVRAWNEKREPVWKTKP